MTQREITKLRVINQTIDSIITIKEAAELLNLSERQIIRIKKGVSEQGPAFVIHKNRGLKPSHTVASDMKKRIVGLKVSNDNYKGANFSHFTELLSEHEGISVSYSTVHRTLTGAGIVSPKNHCKRKDHHRRDRKPRAGMLVQIDASPHVWITDEGVYSLHGAIDDATGNILALFFTKNECMEGYFELMRQIINNHGIPMALYSDRHTIFISPNDGKLTVEEQLAGKRVNLTQFGRAMDELGVSIIKARSPQAKGRIERLWQTLQSRLPVEFKVHEVNTMDGANAFLAKFIASFNARFAVEPKDPKSEFRQLASDINLDTILCIKDERVLINGSAFSYHGKHFELVNNGVMALIPHKAKVTVIDSQNAGIKASYAGMIYETRMIKDRPKAKKVIKAKSDGVNRKTAPAEDHPWRMSTKEKPKLYHEETDLEILEMLDQLFNSTRAWA